MVQKYTVRLKLAAAYSRMHFTIWFIINPTIVDGIANCTKIFIECTANYMGLVHPLIIDTEEWNLFYFSFITLKVANGL
jgi:hypothetical protein